MSYVIYILILLFLGCARPLQVHSPNQLSTKEMKNKISNPSQITKKQKTLWSNSNQRRPQIGPIEIPPPLIEPKRLSNYPDLSTPVSIMVKNASLKQVVLSLAEQVGVNVVFDEDVGDSKVSLNLKDIPLGLALHAILSSHDLYFKPYPYYIRVSRMVTKFFHIDYVMSVRKGQSNTEVSLSSGGGSSESSKTQLNQSSSTGDISVVSSEVVNFWENFEKGLKEILKDPLYNILQAEYNRKLLEEQLALLPYQTQYQKQVQEQQIEMLTLQKEMLKRKLAEGEVSALQTLSNTNGQTPTSTMAETSGNVTTEGSEATKQLVGSYTIDAQTGTVVVTTTPQMMEKVEEFIAKVKKDLSRQVLIDVQIFEVSLNKTHQVGIDWSKFPGTIEFYKLPQLRNIVNAQMASQAAQTGTTGATTGQGIYSPLQTSPFPSSPGGSLQIGLLHSLTPSVTYQWNTDALIAFLKTQGQVRAISRPQLLTLNNQPAIVSVGINDFYITYEQSTTSAQAGLATSSVTSKLNPLFIGVTLSVTPQISASGDIILKIVPVINKKVGQKTVPTGISSAPIQSIPIVETRQTSTIVKAKDGQPIIISGLIQETTAENIKKVPALGDLPLLGPIFRYKSRSQERSELVMVIVPHLQTGDNVKGLGYRHINQTP